MQGHTAVSTLRKGPAAEEGEWIPPIVKTVATKQEGLAELVEAFEKHREFLATTEAGRAIGAQRRADEFRAILVQALVDEMDARFEERVSESLRAVLDGQVDPYTSAQSLVRDALGEET